MNFKLQLGQNQDIASPCSLNIIPKHLGHEPTSLINFLNVIPIQVFQKTIQRGKWKIKTNVECFHPFSPYFLTADNFGSSPLYNIQLYDIKGILDHIVTFVKKIMIFSNKCKYYTGG